jgi:glycosyltransferase involved in cell wall biosynthesis
MTGAHRKVALVLGTSTGGIGAHVHSLVAGLVARGADVVVAGPRSTEERFAFTQAGAVFRPLEVPEGLNALRQVAVLRAARAVLDDREVVHAHGFRAAWAAGVGARGRPLVVTWHNALLGGHGWRQAPLAALQRHVARRADITLGASSDLVAAARDLGARDARLGPVAAPDLPPPTRSRGDVRASLGVGATPVVLTVGRLAPQKDYPLLLDVAARLRGTPVCFLVAGDGPLREQLAARVVAEDLPVRLLGRVDGVADLFAASDVALLTSHWEARALVAQEALRAGVPLVARAVGGIPELVDGAAVLVASEPGELLVAGLAGAVRALLDDPAERARLAEAGRAVSATWPTEADTIEQVRAVYEELLATPRRAR